MNTQEVIERYVQLCEKDLEGNPKIRSRLRNQGVNESFLFESFRLGYSNGSLIELIQGNEDLKARCEQLGFFEDGKEKLKNLVTIPVLDENKAVVNIVGYSIYPQSRKRIKCLKTEGIFNQAFLQNTKELYLTKSPLDSLLLIQSDIPNTTFLFGDDQKYLHFIRSNSIRKVIFTFDGRARLLYELAKNGVSTRRVALDSERLSGRNAKEYLQELFAESPDETLSADAIKEIEGGFLFRFPHLSYRVIGNFSDHTLTMKANIKAFTEEEVFVDHAESGTMPSCNGLSLSKQDLRTVHSA